LQYFNSWGARDLRLCCSKLLQYCNIAILVCAHTYLGRAEGGRGAGASVSYLLQ
jgi:hypothetical protein